MYSKTNLFNLEIINKTMTFTLFPLKNFPNELTATIFSILFVTILLIELRILLRYSNNEEDKGSLWLIVLGILIPLIITIVLSYTNIGQISTSVSYLGLTILLVGFLLRQYSIFILGKFFTPVVEKQKDHKIIQHGLYKYIRHPSYTGLLLEITGFALSLSNIVSLIITLIFFIPAISYRIKIEEQFLSKQFKEYEDYKKQTRKLIPFVY